MLLLSQNIKVAIKCVLLFVCLIAESYYEREHTTDGITTTMVHYGGVGSSSIMMVSGETDQEETKATPLSWAMDTMEATAKGVDLVNEIPRDSSTSINKKGKRRGEPQRAVAPRRKSNHNLVRGEGGGGLRNVVIGEEASSKARHRHRHHRRKMSQLNLRP